MNMQAYDLEGLPIGMDEWARIHDSSDKIVARTVLPDGSLVSTVWLGLAHGEDGGGRPLIFETMVFPEGDTTGDEVFCDRYATLKEARWGHEEVAAGWSDVD